MRTVLTAAALALLFAGSAVAKPNVCRDSQGHFTHCPSVGAHQAPRGAHAQCRDQTYYMSKRHQGACSHHGGVGRWL
jgi:hypothetical protein